MRHYLRVEVNLMRTYIVAHYICQSLGPVHDTACCCGKISKVRPLGPFHIPSIGGVRLSKALAVG